MRAASAGVFNPETDPVCGMEVDRDRAKSAGRTATHDGHAYYFCSDECKKQFDAAPAKYVEPQGQAPVGKAGALPPTHRRRRPCRNRRPCNRPRR